MPSVASKNLARVLGETYFRECACGGGRVFLWGLFTGLVICPEGSVRGLASPDSPCIVSSAHRRRALVATWEDFANSTMS